MHLLERHEESGDEVCTLSLCDSGSTRVRVHHWRPPRGIDASRSSPCSSGRRSCSRTRRHPTARRRDDAVERASPRRAALLQPLLSGRASAVVTAVLEAEPSGASEEQLRRRADRSRRRLLLLSCDPSKEGAIAFWFAPSDQPAPQDEQLVAGPRAPRWRAAEDDTLLAIAAAVSRTHNPALRHRRCHTSRYPPLSFAVCGARAALSPRCRPPSYAHRCAAGGWR